MQTTVAVVLWVLKDKALLLANVKQDSSPAFFMTSNEQNINFSFQARYETLGKLTPETPDIWIVFHGYGQLAKYFIRKFDVLAEKGHFIVAPEGLNRFYLSGFEGRVGATWMTREARLTDISNYINYINTVFEDATKKLSDFNGKINILGFSQGAATACRWLVESNVNFQNLILWAGIFPPDLELKQASKSFSNKSVKVLFGDEDPYITAERMDEMKIICSNLNINPEVIQYSGGHQIEREVLKKLV